MRNLFFLALTFCLAANVYHPTSTSILTGKVKDFDTGEDLVGASVKILKGTDLVRGGVTNYDGEYRFTGLEPGIYDVEVSYTGYQNERITNVQVLDGQINYLDVKLKTGQALQEVVIKEYKIPLISKEETSGGQTLTSQTIRNLPSRNVNAIVATSAGATSVDGPAVNIRGSRSPADIIYVDGIQVAGKPAPSQHFSKKEKKRAEKREQKITADTIFPDESNREQYNQIIENPFLDAEKTPISTFSIDVDVASYSNIRRFLDDDEMPPADAVRIEEMLNYFDYDYPKPTENQAFRAVTELGICPWQPENRLLLVALQGREMDAGQLPPSNFVFLVDVSGSMNEVNKLPLVKTSLELLTENLRPIDRVSMVVYAGAAGLVLPPTAGNEKARIRAAIQNLNAGGSTAGGAGIELAYKIAHENFMKNGNNRVVLCTDGDFNVGVSSEADLTQLIEKQRETGVYLSVLGFGTGNYQDGKMQALADKGNGNHAYIDGLAEAKKVMVKEFGGSFFTIAKDVKLQLDFNPAAVESYRLIGYENRMLAAEDFENDKKDAGELGVGHRVTALYEIKPRHDDREHTHLMDLKFRFKKPSGNAPSELIEQKVAEIPAIEMSENFRLAAAVAEFGLLLRDSKFKGNASWKTCLVAAKTAAKNDRNGYRKELVELIEMAEEVAAERK